MPILLLILAAAWCAYLAFWWRDSRRTALAAAPDSLHRIESFKAGMNTLANSIGSSGPRRAQRSVTAAVPTAGPLPMPRSAQAAAQRRYQVILVLGATAAVSLLLAMFLGLFAVLVHLAADAVLIAYAYGCMRRRHLAAEREIKVRMLYPEGVVPLRPAGLAGERGVFASAGGARMQTG